MSVEEIDKACELCMQEDCTGCEFQDVHFRDVSGMKNPNKLSITNKIEKSMTKGEALKMAANMLRKLYLSNNIDEHDESALGLQAYILTAEADKDYSKMYYMLEELRRFIVKLQEALKKK